MLGTYKFDVAFTYIGSTAWSKLMSSSLCFWLVPYALYSELKDSYFEEKNVVQKRFMSGNSVKLERYNPLVKLYSFIQQMSVVAF